MARKTKQRMRFLLRDYHEGLAWDTVLVRQYQTGVVGTPSISQAVLDEF